MEAERREADAAGRGRRRAPGRNAPRARPRCRAASRSGAPDSSSWPAGSSEIEASPCFRPMVLPSSRIGVAVVAPPGRASRSRMEPGWPSAGSIGRGRKVGEAEAEFLVLGADAELLRAACSRRRCSRPVAASDVIGVAIGVSGIGHGVPRRFRRASRVDDTGVLLAGTATPDACNRASPAMAGGLGPQDARPERHRRYKVHAGRSASSSAGAKPPSGPTSRPAGAAAPGGASAASGALQWRRTGGRSARPGGQQSAQRPRRMRCGTVSRSHCSAASMAMAAQPVLVHPVRRWCVR